MNEPRVFSTKEPVSASRQSGFSRMLDSVISSVAPVRAHRRMQARIASSALQAQQEAWSQASEASQQRKLEQKHRAAMLKFDAADTSRLRESIGISGQESADEELLFTLPKLRARSRDLTNNNPMAAGFMIALVTNIVGQGLRPQSTLDRELLFDLFRFADKKVTRIQRVCERNWRIWSEGEPDSTEQNDFAGLIRLAAERVFTDGDVGMNLPFLKEDYREFGLTIEMIEGDRIDDPLGLPQNNVRMGVEINDRGAPQAYWVQEGHPGDMRFFTKNRNFVRIPKRKNGRLNFIHVFRQRRGGQNRGVPWFHSVIDFFDDVGDYFGAEVTAAEVAACITAFITKEDPARAIGQMETSPEGHRLRNLEPGQVWYGSPGEKAELLNPNRPSPMFSEFIVRILRVIGFAIGIPYELIDHSVANYSGGRSAKIEARKMFRVLQQWLAYKVCKPLYCLVQLEAFARGRFDHLDIDFMAAKEEFIRAKWTPITGDGWVDPLKEIQASAIAVQQKLSTRSDELAAQGKVLEEVLDQLQREEEMMKERGLEVPRGPVQKPTLTKKEEEADDDEDSDED